MTDPNDFRTGTWEPERYWWFFDTVDIFRGLRWSLESAHWSGTMVSRGRSWDVDMHGQRYSLNRPGRAGISVDEVASGSQIASSQPIDRTKGGTIDVRGQPLVFQPHAGDAWQPGELAPRPAHHVYDADDNEVLVVRSGTIKPSFEFRVTEYLDDHIAIPLVALGTAIAIRLRVTGRGARRGGPSHV